MIEEDAGIVTGYIEKPTLHYEVSMGIYAYSPGGPRARPTAVASTSPTSCSRCSQAGERVATYHFDGTWFDIGTTDEHERAVAAFEADPGRFAR